MTRSTAAATSSPQGLRARARNAVGSHAARGFFEGVSRVARLHPRANPARHNVEVLRDIAYVEGSGPAHRLDVWRPKGTHAHSKLPALLYVHGGGFRILSKETHWVMALAFARRGFVVFNVEYRLAPQHPFPAAVQDVCDAYAWVCDHAARYGGDVSRLVVAGESAGANLAATLSVAACYQREEPYARKVFDTGVVPKVVLPACGIFQVSDPDRFTRRRPDLRSIVMDRIREVSSGYLGDAMGLPQDQRAAHYDLADPLLVFERAEPSARELPAFFLPVGTADPLLHDTRRMHTALTALGAPCEARYYPRGIHAFHAFVFRKEAQRCWRDTYAFLDAHLPASAGPQR